MPEAILFDSKPSEVPAGHVLLHLQFVEPEHVRILGGTRTVAAGTVVRLSLWSHSSCTVLGSRQKTAYAVGQFLRRRNKTIEFMPRVYRRHWVDEVLTLVGIDRYTPGELENSLANPADLASGRRSLR
ncbi:hypothetical protein [Sphingobium xanthum]